MCIKLCSRAIEANIDNCLTILTKKRCIIFIGIKTNAEWVQEMNMKNKNLEKTWKLLGEKWRRLQF